MIKVIENCEKVKKLARPYGTIRLPELLRPDSNMSTIKAL